ncbi:MAG: hypothetical protein EOP45_22965 [Sphingobacteriaceae bacterium]|nr:MAG: hypothetical protein EOP45_22965 [Sphingobacteriaceae bacterium]
MQQQFDLTPNEFVLLSNLINMVVLEYDESDFSDKELQHIIDTRNIKRMNLVDTKYLWDVGQWILRIELHSDNESNI